MFYELLKNFADNGLTWGEFAGALLITNCSWYITAWVLGCACCYVWYYIQDGEDQIPNFMSKVLDKVIGNRVGKKELNGYYKSCWTGDLAYYKYRKYKNGELIRSLDELTRLEKLEERVVVKGTGWDVFLNICIPVALTVAILLIDTIPVVMFSLALCYAVMRLARTVVRLVKRVDKHITQPVTEAHKVEGEE